VRVVAWVADDRDTLHVTWDVEVINAQEQFRGIVTLVQKRIPDRPVSVHALQVELGRTGVAELMRIDMVLER